MLHMQLTLTATPEIVFRALTDSEALVVWFAEYADVSLAEKRYDFWGRFTPGAPDRAQGRHPVLELEPDYLLKYAWQVEPIDTTVQIKLTPHDETTTIQVTFEEITPKNDVHVYNFEDFWFLSLENLRRYIDGKPIAARCDFSVSSTGEIHKELEIDGSPEAVFEALIRPEQLERWIASKAVVEPHVGGRYEFGWGEAGGPAKILELVPNEKLVYLWPEGRVETVVTWTLEESGGKTRLTLVHSGFAPDEKLDGIDAGWLNFMNWIKSLVEYGPTWKPPILALSEQAVPYYAASIYAGQSELLPD